MPGIVVDIDSVALRLGDLAVRWYGVAILAAVLGGFAASPREARRRCLDEERFFALGVGAVIMAIFVRMESATLLGLQQAQVIALGVILASVYLGRRATGSLGSEAGGRSGVVVARGGDGG